jgi:hypothetical protein
MTETHPKAAEAQARAAKARAKRAALKADVALFRQRGIHFVHVGNITVAYRVDRRDIVHVNDKFDPLVGKALAGDRLSNGMYITLRRPDNPFKSGKAKMRDLMFHVFTPSATR